MKPHASLLPPRLRNILAGLCVLMLALLTTPASAGGDYVVTVAGQARGEMQVRRNGAKRDISFRFTDRGRGPDTRTRLHTDTAGLPL